MFNKIVYIKIFLVKDSHLYNIFAALNLCDTWIFITYHANIFAMFQV